MRPEQAIAVEKPSLISRASERKIRTSLPFSVERKMRFGKTFAAYQLAKEWDGTRCWC